MKTHQLRWRIDGEEHSFALTAEETHIGRRSDSQIMLLDPYVSRRHARITKMDRGFVLTDLGSTHGTFINDERIEEKTLQHGDRIQLGRGRVELVYQAHRLSDHRISTTLGDNDDDRTILQLTSVLTSGEEDEEQSELEKISHILDFQYQWGKTFSPEKTFQQLIQSALQISGAERGFVLTRDDAAEFQYVVGMDGRGNFMSEAEFQKSNTVVDQVAAKGEALFMTEGIDQEFASQESIVAMHLRAVACMPLFWIDSASGAEEASVQGILYLDSTKTMHALSGLDQKILNKLASEAGNVFEKLEMIKGIEERKAVEKELALAQETQRSLLPQEIPAVEGFVIQAFSHPTRYVGGDFYDFPAVEGEGFTGVLADVSGKGVSAALLSSFIQGALETECRTGAPLDDVLNRTNKYLCRKTQSNRFVTLMLFTLQADGTGEFINAGHNPTFLYRAGGEMEVIDESDMILGAFDFATYNRQQIQLNPKDVLVIYTDGVTDATNPEGEMFGEDRLADIVRDHGAAGAEGLKETILEAVEEFTQGMPQTDDITFMLLERLPAN